MILPNFCKVSHLMLYSHFLWSHHCSYLWTWPACLDTSSWLPYYSTPIYFNCVTIISWSINYHYFGFVLSLSDSHFTVCHSDCISVIYFLHKLYFIHFNNHLFYLNICFNYWVILRCFPAYVLMWFLSSVYFFNRFSIFLSHGYH